MPEVTDGAGRVGSGVRPATTHDPVTERVLATPGLGPLVAEAEVVWRSRATPAVPRSTPVPPGSRSVPASSTPVAPGGTPVAPRRAEVDLIRPGWRPFEDAFPTFYQFTNRPPRTGRG